MSLSVTITAMVQSGCSAEQIAAVVVAHEAKLASEAEARRVAKRAGNAERQRRYRNAHNGVTERDSALQAVTARDPLCPFPEKEKSPPAPPSKEKQTLSQIPIGEANASLVNGEAADARRDVGNVVKIERKPSTAGKTDAVRAAGEWWNDLAASLGLRQIDAIKPGSSREAHAWARCRELAHEFGSLSAGLNAVSAKIRGSPFLCGHVGSFRATFDWVVNAANFQKIIEGNYEDSEEKRAVR